MKKLRIFLLAIAAVLGLSVPVFAAMLTIVSAIMMVF